MMFAQEAARRGLTPEQFKAQQQKQIAEDAAKAGMSVEAYVNKLKLEAFQQHQMRAQQAQQQGQPAQQPNGEPAPQQPQQQQVTQQIPVEPGVAPKPEALAVAKFLRGQDLKSRTVIMDGERKDMFKGRK